MHETACECMRVHVNATVSDVENDDILPNKNILFNFFSFNQQIK